MTINMVIRAIEIYYKLNHQVLVLECIFNMLPAEFSSLSVTKIVPLLAAVVLLHVICRSFHKARGVF